jgi:3-(3-hydroxy-phenyl)propionate hydroxylase
MSVPVPTTTDVAVIGYGPTGAVLANLLGLRGWKVDVFERAHEPLNAPRAVHFDAEVMRVFQQIGIADRLLADVLPIRGMHFLNGEGRTIFQFDAPAADQPLGWPQGFMFHQPDVERILRAAVSHHSTVVTHLGHEVVHVAAADEGGGAVLDINGPDGARTVRARYAIGCCGARSITRAAIGGGVIDYGFTQEWLVLDLLLQRPLELPDVTVQYCEPARPSSYVVMPGLRRRFEFMVMPGDTADGMLEPAMMASLLRRWLQPDDYTVERAAVYAFHALVAEQWRMGPLFIAGDAAHQMPPFLGQGMCAGVRDAANLAWKLDLVLSGVANESLLDTYLPERLAHVRATVEDDILLGSIIQATDPDRARYRDAKATSSGSATTLAPKNYRIGDSLCAAGDAAGQPFPQPRLPDGRWHDELLHDRFALIGHVTPSREAASTLSRLGAIVIPDPALDISYFLKSHNAAAVLVRPDRLVQALIADSASLDAALVPLSAHLHGPHAQ